MAEDRTGVVARLDALEAAHKGATPGKWKVEPNGEISDGEYALVIGRGPVRCMAYCYGGTSTFEGENLPADAAAIVAEHNAMPALLAAVRGVLDRHHRIGEGEPGREVDYCDYDGFVWPCAEYRDLAAALGEA